MARFTAIPSLPQANISDWQYSALSALKENVELLVGTRGEKDGGSAAVVKSAVTVPIPPTQKMQRVTAEGAGFTISKGVVAPSLDDYIKLIGNVQTLASDVAALRSTVQSLIQQLRA